MQNLEMPDEVAESITEAFCNRDSAADYGVEFTDIHQHNACNHTLCGIVKYKDRDYGFIVEIGDWNGFQVNEFCFIEDSSIYAYKPPEPTKFMFVPVSDNLKLENPAMYNVYLKWKEQDWFKKKLSDYHYDRHFQPGSVTEKHYRDWAASKGMRIEALSRD